MTVQKHDLTTGNDNLMGGSGKDFFSAPLIGGAMTLNGTDVLNGGKGVDTVEATLIDGMIDPVMKNIEHGIFASAGLANATIDLSHAAAMTDLTFEKLAGNVDSADIDVADAAHVSSLAIRNSEWEFVELDGVDPTVTTKMQLSFDNTHIVTATLFSPAAASFDKLDIHLNNAVDTTLEGSVGADQMVIHSDGDVADNSGNVFYVTPAQKMSATHHLSVTGGTDLTLFMEGQSAAKLQSVDLTGLHAEYDWLYLGSKHLADVTGGDANDYLSLDAIGGSKQAPSHVNLGAGYVTIELNYAFDADTQRYNGGDGADTIILHGAAENLNRVRSFEDVQVYDAAGVYETKGMDIVNFDIWNTAAATTIDHLVSGATLVFYGNVDNYLDVNVAGAGAKAATNSIRMLLDNDVRIGNQFAGFIATNLSTLQIDSRELGHDVYLGAVGSATDATSIQITGTSHLALHASNAAMNYISSIIVEDNAGVDMSGMVGGSHNFVDSGVSITGGAGADILIGGDGADTITTGGSNNTVIGSLGADYVMLTSGSGMDTLVFNHQSESAYGNAHDTVAYFGAPDKIDLTAIGIDVQFKGNVATDSAGEALLSTTHASAYFNTAEHMLYIDLNHDGKFLAADDMEIKLTDLASFDGTHLLS